MILPNVGLSIATRVPLKLFIEIVGEPVLVLETPMPPAVLVNEFWETTASLDEPI